MTMTHFAPRRRKLAGSKKSKIMKMSKKEYMKTQANMHPVSREIKKCITINHKEVKTQANMHPVSREVKKCIIVNHKEDRLETVPPKQWPCKTINTGQLSAKMASMAKGSIKSNMKQPTLSRSSADGKARLKGHNNTLKRKGDVNCTSPLNCLNDITVSVSETTNRLNQYNDSPDQGEYISTKKLELLKGTRLVPKYNCSSEGKERQDGFENNKDNAIDHMADNLAISGGHALNSTLLSDIQGNLGNISSCSFPKDLTNFQMDKALSMDDNPSTNLSFENVEKTEFVESNMGQLTNCNGKTSNSMSKKRMEPFSKENPNVFNDDDDSKGELHVDNMSGRTRKKLRRSEVEDGSDDLNHVGVEDDTAIVSKNNRAKFSMTPCVGRQCHSCSMPIDKPSWRGIFKIDGKEYISLNGHLSTKSCEKAWSLSRQLLPVVEVKMLPRLEVWPKPWEASEPNGDNIGIYFFPRDMRKDEDLGELVREVMENDLALCAVIGEAQMLIFPSILLPNHHQTFQSKHYLWGVFKRREYISGIVEEPFNIIERTAQAVEKEKQQNHKVQADEPNQEKISMATAIYLERHKVPAESTQEVVASRVKVPTNIGFDLKAPDEEEGHGEATPDAATLLANHEWINPSMGHTPGKLMGFIVQRTPKMDQIIREIEREGALVFTLHGDRR